MASVFIAALFALTPPLNPAPPAAAAPGQLDLRCYRLMAELAEDDDPRIRSAGLIGAQYFLGRIAAAQPGFDPDAAGQGPAESEAERERLIRQCGSLVGQGPRGRDFRLLGDRLVPAPDSI